MSKIERATLSTHGKKLIENGYNIIPIPPGSKAPYTSEGWSKLKATPKQLSEWIGEGMTDFGVGINTKNTPAIDLDISDERVLKKMLDWCQINIGFAPVRYGRHPRALLVFRTDEPFRKMKTGKYLDEWGDEQEIEILCDGQQFVAYAIHPDTRKPYEWSGSEEPFNTHADDLPVLKQEDARALMKYFEEVAKEEGWTKKSNGLSGGVRAIDDDDPFADVESVIDIPNEELRDRLMLIPGAEDYDTWVQIGMALYHQFAGDDEGLQMWHEWSEVADNYDKEALDKHWKSFNIEGKKRAPITARLIIKLAKEAATTAVIAKVGELRDAMFAAKDEAEWREVCAKVRRAEIDSLARAQIADIAKKKYQEITNTKLSVVEVRKAVAYEITNEKTPAWCQDWVFDAQEDKFFHVGTKITMSILGFNSTFSRKALTKKDILEGRVEPSQAPSALALNIYKIPEVYGRSYAPGRDSVFFRDGLRVANTYAEHQVPEIPKELTPRDKRAIQTVKNHIVHMLVDESEQRLFLNWLAWVVQNPGKRVNWAMLLQGVEGDGKSFFAFLLRAVMGISNVRMVNANILEGNFTGWAHGQCVIVVEEPRLQGQNKYDVINKIKPLITNAVIEIHAKGKDPYNVENTSNYFLPTNFRDALPLNDNDRRYCVLFSRWQNRDDLRQFVEANPDYYLNLYRTLEECAPALRKWLIDHEVDADFPAGGDAPSTTAHKYMVAASTPESIRVVNEIISENQHHDISEHLVNATALPDAMIGRDSELPHTSSLQRLLEHNGYTFLGRYKIDGVFGRYWSKVPGKFRVGVDTAPEKIKDYLDARKVEIDNEL